LFIGVISNDVSLNESNPSSVIPISSIQATAKTSINDFEFETIDGKIY